MAIPKKTIKEMTPEEALKMTDDEVMQKIFGKKVVRELRKATGKAQSQRPKKK